MGIFQRTKSKTGGVSGEDRSANATELENYESRERNSNSNFLPSHNSDTHHPNGKKKTPGILEAGESGRSGVHPIHFLRICFRSTSKASTVCNVLWPFVPAAIAIHFARPDLHVWIFALNYIAMVPTANLVGFAGQELARKVPKVFGVILETTLGSLVEIVLFMVLVVTDTNNVNIPVIQAAILGSILTNLLLCLGLCFFVGGLRREEQEFHEVISETGTGLMLVAGFGLLIPSAFFAALKGAVQQDGQGPFTLPTLRQDVLTISRATAIILLVAFMM